MSTIVEFCTTALVLWIFVYITGKVLFELYDFKFNIVTLISILFCASCTVIMNALNFEIFSGIIKFLFTYILFCVFFKNVFKKQWSKTLIGALVFYLCIFVSEIIVVVILGIFTNMIGISMQFMKNNLLINAIITLVGYIIVYILRDNFNKIIYNINNEKIGNILIIIIILITIALLFFRIPFNNWKINAEFITTMIIILGFCIVVFYLIKQKSDIENTTLKYQQEVKYSMATSKVLEDYRMIGHEHKNQLSIIRQMVHKDNIELIEYIDSLILKRNDIKYKWVAELNKLPLEGLKGLINYKLIEAEESDVKTSVIISKDVSKVKLNKLSTIEKDHLYSVCGVYLDNAIQAASKSKDKEIGIQVYKENKELVFILSNTFSGKVELEKIDDYGYSTKGKNHGVGLHLVKNIMEEDILLSQSRKIIENYYVQEFRINIIELLKKKK